jgi:GT2 family glycosyltransferase
MKKCDIVLVSWNHMEFLRPCIEHITQNTRYPYRLIIVDNGSAPETINYLEALKKAAGDEVLLILNKKNVGFVRAVNQGLKASRAPYAAIFNNDTLPGEGWLTGLIEFAEKNPDVGLLNPMCKGHVERNMTVNDYAKTLSASNRGKYMEMNQCQGFGMLVKREVIDRIGYLDERFDTVGFDDTDYSMRAHLAGYRSVSVYSSYVYHREHASFDKMGDRKKIQSVLENRYFAKWPRHLRFAVIFSVSKDTDDDKIVNFLNSALFLAREWCWVNLMIFGGRTARKRIEAVSKEGNFPLHQNIKFNYLNQRFKILEVCARILERSFGRKKRKKYDAVISDEAGFLPLLKFLCSFQKCNAVLMDFSHCSEEKLKEAILPFRKNGLKEKNPAKCDIILPVYGQYEVTKKCVESILKNTSYPYRLIVVNNGADAETRNFLEELSKNKNIEATIVQNSRNVGWVKALNQGIGLSDAPYVCFQNNDTIVTRLWLGKMIDILRSQENFGMICPTCEGRPEHLSIDGYNKVLERSRARFVETDWCRGFSVVIKREVIEKIGPVDERYGLGYHDDVDYSIRAIEAGYLPVKALNTYVYHKRNVTAHKILGNRWNKAHDRNELICHKKWGRPLKIAVILNDKVCKKRDTMNIIEKTAFDLARKQHHIDLWSPQKLNDRFRHTNIKMKVYHPVVLRPALALGLYMNRRKRPEKRYNAVFNAGEGSFNGLAIKKIDDMKEKTKELIDVEL